MESVHPALRSCRREPACRVPVSLWRLLIPASITRIRIFGERTVRPALSVSGIRRSWRPGLVGAGGYFLGTEYDEARINEAPRAAHGTAAVCGLPEQGCIGTRNTRGGELPPATEEHRREDTAVWRMRAIF